MTSQRLRIGIEAQRLFKKNKHGLEVVALEVIKALQKIDTFNQYFIYVKDDEDSNCIQETENFKIRALKRYNYSIWEQLVLPSAVKKDKVDLMHCTSNTAPIFCKTPIVLTLHDIIYMESINFSGSMYQNFGNIYRRLIVPLIINKCKSIITVSNFERQRILNRFNLEESKIRTVYNAKGEIFHDQIPQTHIDTVVKEYNLPKDYILFLGNKAPKKNTKRTLLGYKKYVNSTDNPHPMLILDCSTEYLKKILGEDYKILKPYLHVKAYIHNKDLPSIYTAAKLFLYPSLRESFGIPIIESMACGTPVITSNNSSMLEIADGAGLLIDPFNHDDIGEKIIQILGNSEEYNNLVGLGYERAKMFTWKKNAETTLSLYEEIGCKNLEIA